MNGVYVPAMNQTMFAWSRQQAASLAADELAHSIADGTALDTGRMAQLLAATVRAMAEAQRDPATATAAAVPLETDTRAVGVAVAAREAAAVLATDEQDARTVDREADPAEQCPATRAPEAPAPVREEETEEILAAADERDSRSEIRDQLAEEREKAASLRSFLGNQQNDEYDQYTAGLLVRRAAAMDRPNSKTDRASAASDWTRLSDHLSPVEA